MAQKLVLPIEDGQGYAPDQISTNVTLQELLEGIQEAIQEYGSDSLVVLDNGQRYGARFGAIRPAAPWHEWFQPDEETTL
jgi:hypothetical protein